MARPGRAAALTAVNIAAVIFGSTALFGKLHVSPVWIVAGRSTFAALTLLSIAATRRRIVSPRPPLVKAAFTALLLVIHWTTFFTCVQWASVAVATLTFATFPLFTIVFEAIRQKRRPGALELAAGAAIILAVALIAGPGLPETTRARVGAMIGLSSAVAFAAFGIASQALTKTGDPVSVSLRQNLLVVLLLAPVLPFVGPMPGAAADWFWIAVLGVVATALAHQLYFFSLRRLPVAVCGAFVSLEPVYTIAMAAVLFAEPIGPVVVVSAALIVGASMLLLWRSNTA